MKKISMIISAVLVMAAFASCKKDHTCNCSIQLPNGMGSTSSSSIIKKSTKKDAKDACATIESQMNSSPAGVKATCSLK